MGVYGCHINAPSLPSAGVFRTIVDVVVPFAASGRKVRALPCLCERTVAGFEFPLCGVFDTAEITGTTDRDPHAHSAILVIVTSKYYELINTHTHTRTHACPGPPRISTKRMRVDAHVKYSHLHVQVGLLCAVCGFFFFAFACLCLLVR